MTELEHGCVRGRPADWCAAHHAWFVIGRLHCWGTIRPNGDPLDVTTRTGYASPPTTPVVRRERPTTDDPGMVVVYILAAIVFAAVVAFTLLAVAGRPPHG